MHHEPLRGLTNAGIFGSWLKGLTGFANSEFIRIRADCVGTKCGTPLKGNHPPFWCSTTDEVDVRRLALARREEAPGRDSPCLEAPG